MNYISRRYSIAEMQTLDAIAQEIADCTQCQCSGFSCGDLYFLNVSFNVDQRGTFAQDYAAVLKQGDSFILFEIISLWQFDVAHIRKLLAHCEGLSQPPTAWPISEVVNCNLLQRPHEHGTCPYCA